MANPSIGQGNTGCELSSYELGNTIGVGNFGKVVAATKKQSGDVVAIKLINKQTASQDDNAHGGRPFRERLSREVAHLGRLSHPHVVRLYEFIDAKDLFCLVLERAADKCLFDRVADSGRIPPKETRRLFQQIISGVEYCHLSMIAHRDIKLDNILLDFQDNVKLTDFELSVALRQGECLKTACGSPEYVAPEIVQRVPYSGPAVDIWSCGVVLYTMLVGRYPWGKGSTPEQFHRIKQGKYVVPAYVPERTADLITQILVVDPEKRYSIQQIHEHDWFAQDMPEDLSALNLCRKNSGTFKKQPESACPIVKSDELQVLEKRNVLHVAADPTVPCGRARRNAYRRRRCRAN